MRARVMGRGKREDRREEDLGRTKKKGQRGERGKEKEEKEGGRNNEMGRQEEGGQDYV